MGIIIVPYLITKFFKDFAHKMNSEWLLYYTWEQPLFTRIVAYESFWFGIVAWAILIVSLSRTTGGLAHEWGNKSSNLVVDLGLIIIGALIAVIAWNLPIGRKAYSIYRRCWFDIPHLEPWTVWMVVPKPLAMYKIYKLLWRLLKELYYSILRLPKALKRLGRGVKNIFDKEERR